MVRQRHGISSFGLIGWVVADLALVFALIFTSGGIALGPAASSDADLLSAAGDVGQEGDLSDGAGADDDDTRGVADPTLENDLILQACVPGLQSPPHIFTIRHEDFGIVGASMTEDQSLALTEFIVSELRASALTGSPVGLLQTYTDRDGDGQETAISFEINTLILEEFSEASELGPPAIDRSTGDQRVRSFLGQDGFGTTTIEWFEVRSCE